MVEKVKVRLKAEPKVAATDFKNFHLRRIVKENHNSPIFHIQIGHDQQKLSSITGSEAGTYAFEVEPKDLSHLLATVANSQLSVYDNEHYGDHLDLMCHYKIPEVEEEDVEFYGVLLDKEPRGCYNCFWWEAWRDPFGLVGVFTGVC